MGSDDLDPQFSKVRRADRAVTDESWIREQFTQAAFVVIATERAGQPYALPFNFVLAPNERTLYIHTGHAGRFNENVAANNRVALTVARPGRLLPSDRAGAFGSEYASVVAFGKATLVEDMNEKRRALQMLLDRFFPDHHSERDYRPLTAGEIDSTAVYRVDITHWTGKRNEKPDRTDAIPFRPQS